MRYFVRLAVAVLLCVNSQAQSSTGNTNNGADIFVGYTFTSTDLLETPEVVPGTRTGFHGGTAEFTWNASRHVGLTGQFSGVRTSQRLSESSTDAHVYTFLFGPKLTQQVDQFQLFAHVLFGGAHATISSDLLPNGSASDTDFAMAIGGGVDWIGKNNGHFAFRIAQLDYMMAQVYGSHTSYDRVSTGVIFRF